MKSPDWFKVHTEYLNSNLRTIVDALRLQIHHENPLATAELKSAVDRLNEAAEAFTDELYRSQLGKGK